MKRVLSLLLLIPFLFTQAWAKRGGPYDGALGNSQAFLSGTYGVSLDLDPNNSIYEPNPSLDSNFTSRLDTSDFNGGGSRSSVGVMSMTVPTSGLVTGRALLFERGSFYFGNANGRVDFRSGKMRLLAQLSHYLTADTLAADVTNTFVVVDYMLSGKVDLVLTMNNTLGVIEVSGNAVFARNDLTLEGDINSVTTITTDTSTTTTVDNYGSGTVTYSEKLLRFKPADFKGVRDPSMILYMTADGVRESLTVSEPATFTAPTDKSAYQLGVTPGGAGTGTGTGTGTGN